MARSREGWLSSASLWVKLVVFSALLSAVTVAGTFFALSFTIRGHTRDFLAGTLASHQRMLAELQRRTLQELVQASSLMSGSPTLLAAMETYRSEMAAGDPARRDLLATIQIEVEKIAGHLPTDLLVVTNEDGRVLATSGSEQRRPPVGESLQSHEVVRHALLQDTPVGPRNFAVLRWKGKLFQVGCVPILLQSYIVGTLMLGERIDQAFVEELGNSFGGHVIVHSGERLLGSTLPPASLAGSALLRPIRGPLEESSVMRIADEEYVTVPVVLGQDDGGRAVTLHFLRSLTAAMAGSSRSLLLAMTGYGLLVILMSGISAWLVSRAVLRPLQGLVEFMRASAESGDRSRRFETQHPGPEIRILSSAFNRLMDSLKRHEERLLEKAREDLEHMDRLKESEKLAAVGRMLSGAAHEINNPMTGVVGHIELLLRGEDLSERTRQRLEQVREQGHRVVALTRNLLRVARRDDGQRVPVKINRILSDTLALRRRDFERAGIAIHLELSTDDLEITANELELSQVFLNIINNAYDALTEAGGRRSLFIATSSETDRATIVFADDGPGLKDPQQVFEHFYTTKPLGQGTGLGLSITHAIVRSHGGQIIADNRPEGGARFTITLPHVAEETAVRSTVAPAEEVPLSRRPLPASILVVDDEPVVRELQLAILDSVGARAVAAPSMEEAMERISSQDFDLIVADVMEDADVTGKALYDWILENRSRGAQGVVFVTGQADGIVGFLEEERLPYLRKPFEMEEYVRTLREVLDEAR